MKKSVLSIITAVVMCFVSLGNANAQDVFFGSQEENPGGWDFDVVCASVKHSSNNKSRKVKLSMPSSFNFGFIGGINQAGGVSIDMGQSYELEWCDVISAKARLGHKSIIRIGLGLDWRNYRMTNGKMFNKEPESGKINLSGFQEGVEPKFSRVHTFSLSVPVKYYYRFNKNVTFAVGPELYFTPHGSIKNRYKVNGKSEKTLDTNIHHSRFSVGVGAQLSVHGIGVYYKYNPFNVLSTDYGPKFSTMTVGLKVGL